MMQAEANRRKQSMIIIGLTGSIGTGKSTVTKQFAQCGAATLDSDQVVHALLGPGGEAVKAVAKLFPDTYQNGEINRKLLGAEVFGNPEKRKQLEAIVHPLVRKAQEEFIQKARISGSRFVVLDIPLLFETGAEKRCDVTVVTTASLSVQRSRVLAREGMTQEKFNHILAAQMPDAEKRRLGDFVVPTGRGKAESLRRVKQILSQLSSRFPIHQIMR